MTSSKSWALIVVGYCILAVAMVTFLTINGQPSTAAGTIGTAGLIGFGLVLPTVGMLQLAGRIDPSNGAARSGLLLQSLGLIGILIGLLLSFFASSLPGHLVSAVFIALAGTSGLVGAALLSKGVGARLLMVGAALIAIGAALIPASNIAVQQYLISDLEKNVYQDIGAALAACGCVVAAYVFFVLRSRDRASTLLLS